MSGLFRRASLLAALVLTVAPPGTALAQPCWRPPVKAPVADPFRAPSCAWCPGNRGIEYRTTHGTTVTAVASGRVSYAGNIAGTVYVVVRHGDARRVTYANLAANDFEVGDLVVRGQRIGRTAGRFHLGVREGERYVDPARFIGEMVRPARLIPVDGRPGNPAPPPRLRCERDV